MWPAVLLPVGPQTTGQIVQVLKGIQFHCVNTHKAVSDRHWHFFGASANNGVNQYNHLVFHECGRPRILYIAFEGRTAMFNVYDNLEHAMDSRPALREAIEEVTQLREMQEQTFEEYKEWKPDTED